MKVRNDLLILNFAVVVLIIVTAFFPSSFLRWVLGVPFLLFFPGYAFMAAVFPRKDSLDAIERIALSLATSVALVPLVGLAVNYLPWGGITVEAILYSVGPLILVASVIAWQRRRRLPAEERFTVELQLRPPGRGASLRDRVQFAVLAVAVMVLLGAVGYAMAVPRVDEEFTEFYLLGVDGQASGYPAEVRLGDDARVILGVVNHEGRTVRYRVEITIDGVADGEAGPFVLEDGERWQEDVSFTPDRAGDDQRVRFVLYKDSESEPSSEWLQLLVDVTE